MSLVNCPECGNQMSEQADFCPKCGYKVNTLTAMQLKKKESTFHTTFKQGAQVVLAIFIIGWFGVKYQTQKEKYEADRSYPISTTKSSYQGQQVSHTEKQNPIKITASMLWNNYNANEVRGDDEYKGKLLQVKGRIKEIKKDFADETVILFSTGNEYEPVHAFIAKSDVPIAATLAIGNIVEVKCVGAGMIVSDPMLKDCSFVEQQAK